MAKNITVMLVDDHVLVRTGLKALLEQEADIKVVGEAESGERALKMVRELKPDIVLMDIKMPGIGGLETTKRMLRLFPDVRVIVVTSYAEDPYPAKLIQTGASGFLAKDCASEELIDAIRRVHRGNRYVSAKIAQDLAIRSVSRGAQAGGKDASSLIGGLSNREMQILVMLGHGMKIQEIAEKLLVTSKTINTYRYRLYHKLDAKTDVDLTHIAIRHNLVDVDKRKSQVEG
jgi:two-component system, NarL family, invasion response regulator UvrY